MDPPGYAHLIFDKGAKIIQWRKESPFPQMLLGKMDICMQKTETRSMLVTLYKYKLKVD
jgi:hypothetical protein